MIYDPISYTFGTSHALQIPQII